MITTYFIGGSPCSGKSTTAEILAKNYHFYYFKVDDKLEEYIRLGVAKNYKICKKQMLMTPEQNWMRDAVVQFQEEMMFYEETFEFALHDLEQIHGYDAIITEGAAYMPNLMQKHKIPANRYMSIVPTREFQIYHYEKREFVPYVLEGCSDKKAAFSNWMERDVLFAKEMTNRCIDAGYQNIINDGNVPIPEMVHQIAVQFGLEA